MKLTKKNAWLIGGTLVVLLAMCIAAFAQIGPKKVMSNIIHSQSDKQIAKDLAALSGLNVDEVLDLYDAVGNWDKVTDNIFVYTKVLTVAKKDKMAVAEVFELIEKHEPRELLSVYEFLDNNETGLKKAKDILAKHKQGTSLEELFASTVDTKTYKVYKPASEDEIREILSKGYSPQDVINADTIARAKDLPLMKVLESKLKELTWTQVGKKFGYQFEVTDSPEVSVSLKGTTGLNQVSGKDYGDVVNKINNKTLQDKATFEKKVTQEVGVTEAQMTQYKNQGLSSWDIKNATMLSKKAGKPMEDILEERKDGKSWEEILSKYSG